MNHSEWDCTLEDSSLRLGFRVIKGMSAVHGERIVLNRNRKFASLAEFQRKTKLSRHVLERLANADAFDSLGLSRRDVLWQVAGLDDSPSPLFEKSIDENDEVNLPVMPEQQEVMTDYATAGLSLKQHPVSFLRDQLSESKVRPAQELSTAKNGRWIQVAGLVLIRQRPGTASGIVFMTIEDETGIANLVVKPAVYDRYRAAARHASLLQADGYVQREGQVVHVIVKRLHNLSDRLTGSTPKSRDFH